MHEQATKDNSKRIAEQTKALMAPKRFLFSIPSEKTEEDRITEPSVDITHKFSDLTIKNFTPPEDYERAYNLVCEYMIETLRKSCSILFFKCSGEIKNNLENLNVKNPIECIKVFEAMAIEMAKLSRRDSSSLGEYEKLLQSNELRVRDLIRNEQIYQLNFEQLNIKTDTLQRTIDELKEAETENKGIIEDLSNETAKLTSLIRMKDEEIKMLYYEKQKLSQNGSGSLVNSQIEYSPLSPETTRSNRPGFQGNHLKIVVNEHRVTPTDFEKGSPTYDSGRTLSTMKSVKSPNSTRLKSTRSTIIAELSSLNAKGLKLNIGEKLTSARDIGGKDQSMINSDRRNPEMMKSYNFSGSLGKTMDNYGMSQTARGPGGFQQLPDMSPSYKKSRVLQVTKARRENKSYAEKTLSPSKIYKNSEEQDAVITRMDSSMGDKRKGSLVFRERSDLNQFEDPRGANYIRMNESQYSPFTNRRNTGTVKTRPGQADSSNNSFKSMDQKSLGLAIKQSQNGTMASGILSHRSLKKVKQGPVEGKGTKYIKGNSPLVNIMMKKFSEQETGVKKYA